MDTRFLTRRFWLSQLGCVLLAPALSACRRDEAAQNASSPADGPGQPVSGTTPPTSFFDLPRLAEDGAALGPPLCLGLPAVLALTAQPALAIVPDWGLDMQASTLRDRLWVQVHDALSVADPHAAGSPPARASAGEPDWDKAVRQLILHWPAGKTATQENAQALAGAALSRYGNVLGVPFHRLNIVTDRMPAAIIRPLRAGEAPLHTEPQLRALGDQAVDRVMLEYKDEPIAPLLADLRQRFGTPVLEEMHPATHMKDLPNTVWQRGPETLVLLPRTDTAADLHLMDAEQLDDKGWFGRKLAIDASTAGLFRTQRIRQLSA
jgi:hypothetical protein